MTATVGPAPSPSPAAVPARPGFRDDIQGLRALAVLLVLGYHAGVPQLAGGFVGVDVFFVISGFLITGLILREVDRTGTLSLADFYARRARRLLPATAVVLSATALLTYLFLPITRWSTIVWDLITSALYVTNWWLADQSVEYLAAEGAPSPVQHFWTLAVEEQFYIVWPLLLLVLIAVHRRTGRPLRPLLLTGIVVLAAASLLWSIHLTEAAPARAYFVTTTRVWELAIGAMLAFAIEPAGRLSDRARQRLVFGGTAAIAFAALTYDAGTSFPGVAAAVPTLGAAAVIAGGTGRAAPGIGELYANRPMRTIGGLSYSLYLWHWPLLVVAGHVLAEPGETLPVTTGLAVVTVAALPAWVTFRYVEAPIHHARSLAHHRPRNAVLAGVCTLVGVLAGVGIAVAVPATTTPAPATALGAGVLHEDAPSDGPGDATPPPPLADLEVADDADFVPGPVEALEDVATLAGERCILGLDDVDLDPCVYGPPDATTTVAVVGDSKMHQWLSAIEVIADRRGWRVVTYLKSGCPLTAVDTPRDGGANRPCAQHNELRRAALFEGDFDLVLTSQRASAAHLPGAPIEVRRRAIAENQARLWQALEDAGSEVVIVLDNADPDMIVPDCVASHLDRLSACAFDRREGVARSAAPVQLDAAARAPDVGVADLQDWICLPEVCPAVLGDVLVYRQGSHLTATYTLSLTEQLDEAIAAATG